MFSLSVNTFAAVFNKNHYVPRVISDSLGMTCFNAGEDGNCIILAYGYLQMIMKRHVPKLVIYEIMFCVSPSYKGYHTDAYDKVQQLCESEGAYFWNYFDCKAIVNDKSNFQDQIHMNDSGARKYTSIIVQRLKDVV